MPSIRMLCFIQQDSLNLQQMQDIERDVQALSSAHFGADRKIVTLWVAVPHGQSYVAEVQSRASVVQVAVPDATLLLDRHRFMYAFLDLWMKHTGHSADRLVLSVPTDELQGSMERSALKRVHFGFRLLGVARMALRLGSARRRSGVRLITINETA